MHRDQSPCARHSTDCGRGSLQLKEGCELERAAAQTYPSLVPANGTIQSQMPHVRMRSLLLRHASSRTDMRVAGALDAPGTCAFFMVLPTKANLKMRLARRAWLQHVCVHVFQIAVPQTINLNDSMCIYIYIAL